MLRCSQRIAAIIGRQAVEGLEFNRLFDRQPNEDAVSAAINEIPSWRVQVMVCHGFLTLQHPGPSKNIQMAPIGPHKKRDGESEQK